MSTTQSSINERDKPFILALLATAIFSGIIAVGAYGAYLEIQPLIEYAKNFGTVVFGLMSTAWAWYFKSKD